MAEGQHLTLTVWVVYISPTDYPDKFVLRGQHIERRGNHAVIVRDKNCVVADDLAGIRSQLPPGLVNLGRQPNDDPVIYETWI